MAAARVAHLDREGFHIGERADEWCIGQLLVGDACPIPLDDVELAMEIQVLPIQISHVLLILKLLVHQLLLTESMANILRLLVDLILKRVGVLVITDL